MIGSTSTLTLLSINTMKKAGAPVEAVGYKNHTEILLQVAGGHIPMGLITGGGNSLFEMAQAGKVKILGSTFVKPMNIKGIDIPSVSQQLKIPQYDGAQWLSISPGDSAEHQQLTKDIKNILASEAFQSILPGQVVFPSGSKESPLAFIQRWRNTVVKNRDLISQ
jgi:tripartite-type tricarboxylate transporter receptor subunit TctC